MPAASWHTPFAATTLTVAQMAEDALALIDAEGWPAVHVIGHSLSGTVALQLALVARPRVRSLSLLCTFARGRDAGASLRMAWIGMRSRVGTRRSRRNAFLEILAPPSALAGADRDALAATMAIHIGHDLADHDRVEFQQLSALRAFDATSQPGTLAGISTLVVSAEHDPISLPRVGAAIAAGIPGAQYVLLENASHGVPIHEPARINALLLNHLRRADQVMPI